LLTLLSKGDKLISLDSILARMSPYENALAKQRFDRLYPMQKKFFVESNDIAVGFNGGYYTLASIYAAKGDLAKVTNCLDTTIRYSGWDKASFLNSLSTWLSFGHFTPVTANDLLDYFGKKRRKGQELAKADFVKLWVDYVYQAKISGGDRARRSFGYLTSVTSYIANNQQRSSLIDYFWSVQKPVLNGRREALSHEALYYKLKGAFCGEIKGDTTEANLYYRKAFDTFMKLDSAEQQQEVTIATGFGSQATIPLSYYFLYPCQRNLDNWQSPDNLSLTFARFVVNNNLLRPYQRRLDGYVDFQRVYFNSVKGDASLSDAKINYAFFDFGNRLRQSASDMDKALLDLVYANKAFDENDTVTAFGICEKLYPVLSSVADPAFYKSKSRRYLVKNLLVNLAVFNKTEKVLYLLSRTEPYLKRNAIIDITEALRKKGPTENTFLYFDKYFAGLEAKRIYGMKILRILASTGTKRTYNYSAERMRDLRELVKPFGYINHIKGVIDSERYYEATQYMSNYVSSNKEMQVYNALLTHYIIGKIEKGQLGASDLAGLKKSYAYSGGLDYESDDASNFKFDSLD
jgi:hypothetical protein